MSLASASASQRALVSRRGWELQELTQSGRSRLMHCRPHGHFDGFQIQMPRFAPPRKDHSKQLIYFARDFLADCFGRFFSSGESVVSIGRARQILSLTSNSS